MTFGKHLQFIIFVTLLLSIVIQNVTSGPTLLPETKRTEGALIRTVPAGTNAELKCTSNDEHHNFQYWHLIDQGLIIGPGNSYDKAKFIFQILNGTLIVREISKQEEGLYECVSRGVRTENVNIRLVRMIVANDWREEYMLDNDVKFHDKLNTIKILVIAITLVLISMGAYFVWRIWKDKYRYPSYLQQDEDDDDDESVEELFSQPSTSKSVNNIVPAKSPAPKDPFTNVDISTDFKSILDMANDK